MLVDFDTISDHSRIWIYASEKKLINDQKNYILKTVSTHLQNWEAHRKPLTAGVSILENHFIVIALDEAGNEVSGCSIDILQNNIQEIEKELSISLMNRLNIFYKEGGDIRCVPAFRLGSVAGPDTLFYDLTIQKKSDLDCYLKPIREGWCAYLLNNL